MSASFPNTAPFTVEVTFSIQPEGYLRQMAGTTFLGLLVADPGTPAVVAPGLRMDAPVRRRLDGQAIGALADFAERCEAAGAVLGFEMPAENAPAQPFDYLSVDEMSGDFRASNEGRQSHEWHLYRKENRFNLGYHHGKFGFRSESFDTVSAGLYRLQALVDGHAWEDFGSEESRRTLLHKGQFYWVTQRRSKPIPVDNFVFNLKGHSFCIAGCGGQSILSWEAGGQRAHVWLDDHAQSLDKLAGILAGELNPQAFHAPDVEDGWNPEAVPALPQPLLGKIHVLSIFRSNDRHLANTLVYRTGQGHRVRLVMSNTRLNVTTTDLGGQAVRSDFAVNDKPAAFRALARALRGNPGV